MLADANDHTVKNLECWALRLRKRFVFEIRLYTVLVDTKGLGP